MDSLDLASLNALPKGYCSWWSEVSNHLGAIYPFLDTQSPAECSIDIQSIIENRRNRHSPVSLDCSAIVSKAVLPFLLGNRTLLHGIRRAPWMSYPDAEGGWHPSHLPEHGKVNANPSEFVENLKRELLNEASGYIGGAKKVGILLSGGMDSRVVAGILRLLQKMSDYSFDVVALTWGAENSRDVIYSKKIVDRFDWGWQHYPIDADTLSENILNSAMLGAEVSPLHLHAMPQVAKATDIDVILAGSYGDSVGRAEFSGRHVKKLRSVLPKILDPFGVIRHDALKAAMPDINFDLQDSFHVGQSTPNLRRYEIEQQMHYMRRMLQSCMLTIAKETKFYQMFTHPYVFGLMWSLDPSIRDDRWYAYLLDELPGNLLDIPWARTGCRYNNSSDEPDNHSRIYHSYGKWLRCDLREEIERRVYSERVSALGVFNERGLNFAFNAWKKADTVTSNRLDELFSWIASLHDFMSLYDIDSSCAKKTFSWADELSAVRGGAYARLYIKGRQRIRD